QIRLGEPSRRDIVPVGRTSTKWVAVEERTDNYLIEKGICPPDSARHEIPVRRLVWPDEPAAKLTHQLFRYPAKFHPPVVRRLIEMFSQNGDLVADPFCGSGTALVEAATLGRHVAGSDIDPLAVFVARAKTTRVVHRELESATKRLLAVVQANRRPEGEYQHLQFEDISSVEMEAAIAIEDLPVPNLPRITHWFRRYVIVDLARIRQAILAIRCRPNVRRYLLLAFASIIRNSSNADPVPVSGLEYTAHMKRRDELGRLVNPYALLERSLANILEGSGAFSTNCSREIKIDVRQGDARRTRRGLRGKCDLVVTSPPYYNAVDYYRRHLLEMFWLGLTVTDEQRLSLLPHYIGRKTVRVAARGGGAKPPGPISRGVVSRMETVSPSTARSFRHYLSAMRESMFAISGSMRAGGCLALVMGTNRWRGEQLPVLESIQECAPPELVLREVHWYPLKNRYMSYARNHDADIAEEHVLIFLRSNT
ncbi:MAG: hypothetical protein KDK08_06140, partial [Rhizobiaceae bacterium]|nr:hypothetical protein [Rhizobiaceae bacterium]